MTHMEALKRSIESSCTKPCIFSRAPQMSPDFGGEILETFRAVVGLHTNIQASAISTPTLPPYVISINGLVRTGAPALARETRKHVVALCLCRHGR